MGYIEINILERERIVEIWLTKTEKHQKNITAILKPLYAEYKSKKYIVAVYESGDGDLLGKTKDLILHNREVLA